MINADTAYTIPFVTMAAGVPTNATGTPTAVVWRNGSAEATSVNVVLTSNTGIYHATFTTGSGWAKTDRIWLVVSATISGTAYKGIAWDSFAEPDAVMRGTDEANTTTPPTIPDIVDGVHEADTRDYDDIPGSIGWEFKKLRQANPFIEFEVTDDITPTDTEFAVNITETHDDGSFQDSVLCFTEGDLVYDNNPILSLVKHTGYSVITLQKPMRVAPEVGDKGIINPLSHVYSIEETQDGLALEATSQSILTAINEIDVDFGPIETLIETSTQTILTAIAEEDDPTNVVNLQIAIKDQNDIGVAGVYVSIHGTAKSAVTNINGVAELWVNPNTNYNLRFVVPPGYTPLPEENIVVGINDIEEVYVSPQIATPSIPEELCELRIYIKSQGTTEVGSLENIRVNAKLIDDYKIVNQNLFINIIDVAESDENGYVALVLLKDTDYVLSLTRENSIVIKRILIKTTNNAVQTLSEVVNA